MSLAPYDHLTVNRAGTTPISADAAQRYVDRLRAAPGFASLGRSFDLYIEDTRSLPALEGFHLDDRRAVYMDIELGVLARPTVGLVRPDRVVPDRALGAAFHLLDQSLERGLFVHFRCDVTRPGSPPFDPEDFRDLTVGVGHNGRDGSPWDGPRSELSLGVQTVTGYETRPRTAPELADAYNAALAAVGVAPALSVEALPAEAGGATGSGAAAFVVRDPRYLQVPDHVRRVDGERSLVAQRAALAAGRAFVRSQWDAEKRVPDRLTILDPAAAFDSGAVRRVLAAWGGRVYDGSLSIKLTADEYAAFRAEHDGRAPLGPWSLRVSVLGVREVAAVERTPGLTGDAFPIGLVGAGGPDQIALDLEAVWGGASTSYRVRAFAKSLRTDTAGVLGRLLGDPGAVAWP